MSYLTDEQEAEEALEWWGRYPDSIEALVSLSDDTASDEHGNVLGHVEWQYHPAFKIMLAGSNGLVYSTRHAKKASGWHRFFVIGEEKETQRILKRRLQASNKATKMNTHSNETGTTDMTTQAQAVKNIARTIIAETSGNDLHSVGELLASIREEFGDDFTVNNDFTVHHEGFDWRIIHQDDIDEILESELNDDEYALGCFTPWCLAAVLPMKQSKIEDLQDNEAFEALGAMVVSLDKVGELASMLVSHDGYGHHFSSYDGNEYEAGEYHIFNQG
jgi:hypothetical protein